MNPHLRARGLEIIGGDRSSLNLKKHRACHPVPLVRLDFRALPFRSACADGVFCAFTSWGYFASEEENLRQLTEFARVLRPGGALLLDLAGRAFLRSSLKGVEGDGWNFPMRATKSGRGGAPTFAASSPSASAWENPSATTSGSPRMPKSEPAWTRLDSKLPRPMAG